MVLIARLYHLACSLYVLKLSEISVQSDDARVTAMVHEVVNTMS